jgi:hypothetical protein
MVTYSINQCGKLRSGALQLCIRQLLAIEVHTIKGDFPPTINLDLVLRIEYKLKVPRTVDRPHLVQTSEDSGHHPRGCIISQVPM